jgi:hypothetical protein
MALDFRASQFRGAKFISSGSTGTGAKILFYDISADSTTTPNIGTINTAKFGTGSIGTDIFLYVSGAIGSRGVANSGGTTVFGGDVFVSGNISGNGSGLSNFWQSTTNAVTFTTGSVKVTGSLEALTLSASSGAIITGSLIHGINESAGLDAHAQGFGTNAGGAYSHAEGFGTTASFNYGHAEGYQSVSTGEAAHAEGLRSLASEIAAHAEGFRTTASNLYSHAEGFRTIASGVGSHAAGTGSITVGAYSYAGGIVTIASGSGQTVVGQYNKTNNDDSLFIIGNGSSDTVRSDIFLVNQANLMIGSGSIGSDVFLFVSGNLNGNSSATNKTILPDTILSGNIWFKSSSINTIPKIFNGNRTGGILFSGSNLSLVETSTAGKIQVHNSTTEVIPNTDVFFFVSGTINSAEKVALLRDTVVSGNLYIDAETSPFTPGAIYFKSGSVLPFQIYVDTGIAWTIANYDPNTPHTTIYSDTGRISLSAPGGVTSSNLLVPSFQTLQAAQMSGSHQRLTNGTPAFVSGGNIQITTQSNGAVAISGSATYMTIGSYTSTTQTSSNPQSAGQAALDRTEFYNTQNIYMRNILSTTTGSVTASVMLYNVTSGSYVHIGGAGITILSTSNTTPTIKQSVNLLGATNFITGSSANIYEVQVFVSTGSQQAILGSSMFVCV